MLKYRALTVFRALCHFHLELCVFSVYFYRNESDCAWERNNSLSNNSNGKNWFLPRKIQSSNFLMERITDKVRGISILVIPSYKVHINFLLCHEVYFQPTESVVYWAYGITKSNFALYGNWSKSGRDEQPCLKSWPWHVNVENRPPRKFVLSAECWAENPGSYAHTNIHTCPHRQNFFFIYEMWNYWIIQT